MGSRIYICGNAMVFAKTGSGQTYEGNVETKGWLAFYYLLLLLQYPDDLFPAEDKLLGSSSAKGLGSGGLEVAPDSRIAYMLKGPEWSPSKGEVARKSLMSEQHWQHASIRERSSHKPSIEDPHNGIHGGLRGVMATYESSFHPIFWLHHNNIDRFYQKYVELHPDSMEEFKLKQVRTVLYAYHVRYHV